MFTLYNQDFQPITRREIIINSPLLHIYANQIFGIRIITDNTKSRLYSQNSVSYSQISDSNNYTIFVPTNGLKILIEIIPLDGVSNTIVYSVEYNDGNILSPDQLFYNDLLVNYHLPSLEDLLSAKVDSVKYDSSNILKRMLLDFNEMLKNKGTKESVENLFKLLGYEDYSDSKVSLYDIWEKPGGDFTTEGNSEIDRKTGLYSLTYQFFTKLTPELDRLNMPNIELDIDTFDQFSKNILNAARLANIYFCAAEQKIEFFELVIMCNIPVFISNLNRNYLHSFYDVNAFRNIIDISSWGFEVTEMPDDQLIPTDYVKDNLQLLEDVKVKEVRFLTNNANFNNFLFEEIDEEVTDTSSVEDWQIENIDRGFGGIIHLKIDIPIAVDSNNRHFVEFELYDENDDLVKYEFNKKEFLSPIIKSFALYKYTTYLLNIRISDAYGSAETYNYKYILSDESVILDVDVWNSSRLLDSTEVYSLSTETTEPNLSLTANIIDWSGGQYKNMILPQDLVPQLLSDYQNVVPDSDTNWMEGNFNARDIFKRFNQNNKVVDITQTIPLGLVDAFIDIVSIKYIDGDKLVFKIYDPDSIIKYVSYQDIGLYSKSRDHFFIQLIDVIEQDDTISREWMIFTTVSGFQIPKDFLYVERDGEYISFDSDIQTIPIYYDIPLLFSPGYIEGYISPSAHKIQINDLEVDIIKNVFPYLIKRLIGNAFDDYELKINDILVVRLSEQYIYFPFECRWLIKDSFSGNVLFQSDEKALKWRCNIKTVIDIVGEFYLKGTINGDILMNTFQQSIQVIG
jgi:hypothetical protein